MKDSLFPNSFFSLFLVGLIFTNWFPHANALSSLDLRIKNRADSLGRYYTSHQDRGEDDLDLIAWLKPVLLFI